MTWNKLSPQEQQAEMVRLTYTDPETLRADAESRVKAATRRRLDVGMSPAEIRHEVERRLTQRVSEARSEEHRLAMRSAHARHQRWVEEELRE